MPSGYVAPGCVFPTCGFGHHHVVARPSCAGRLVASVPMKGSTRSNIGPLLALVLGGHRVAWGDDCVHASWEGRYGGSVAGGFRRPQHRTDATSIVGRPPRSPIAVRTSS